MPKFVMITFLSSSVPQLNTLFSSNGSLCQKVVELFFPLLDQTFLSSLRSLFFATPLAQIIMIVTSFSYLSLLWIVYTRRTPSDKTILRGPSLPITLPDPEFFITPPNLSICQLTCCNFFSPPSKYRSFLILSPSLRLFSYFLPALHLE